MGHVEWSSVVAPQTYVKEAISVRKALLACPHVHTHTLLLYQLSTIYSS